MRPTPLAASPTLGGVVALARLPPVATPPSRVDGVPGVAEPRPLPFDDPERARVRSSPALVAR